MADHDDEGVRLALLAHDLRTPLSAMRLTAELIGSGSLDEDQVEQLEILIRSIDALTEMTGELLDLEAPEAGLAEGESSIAEILSECAGLFRIAAAAKGLTFDLSVEADAATKSTGHGGALRRMVMTLLDNAVKYTREGGITLALKCIPAAVSENSGTGDRPWISVAVSDTGPGIDPEERARLFRPYVRGRHGRETAPGTGLGLWGTAKLVEEIGGRLLLATPAGGGSRFEVQIPPGDRDGGGDGVMDAGSAGVEDGSKDGGKGVVKAGAGGDRQAPGTVPGRLHAHVLIVDDNATNCRLLSALVESFGVTSDVAGSGVDALELVRSNAYDAALVDLHMPGMNGVQTAKELRALRSEAELPLIAVTAALESIGDDGLREAGFADALTKPLSPAELHAVLAGICGEGAAGQDS